MIKKIVKFFKGYRKLALVVITMLAALPFDISGQHLIAHWILGLSAILLVIPMLWNMVQDLRAGTFGVDVLAATAIISAVALGEYWAGIIIILMLTGGESLEDFAAARARNELDALLSSAPKKARILRGRKTIEMLASQVKANDKLIIRAGELVPVDAIIIEGSASFDESSLTGESLPTPKTVNEELLSGSINMDGVVTARALRTAEDSQFEQIIQLVKAAASSKSPFVRLADRYSIPFTIVAFVIAGTAWVMSGQSIRFLEVLVVATPCPLILAAPIALISGISRSAKHGIIMKNGTALERLASIRTLAFDKTGTLTKGQPLVDKIITTHQYSASDVLSLAASLEQNSNHILAKTIVKKALGDGLKLTKVKSFQEIPGKGLVGVLGGRVVVVGRDILMKEDDISIPGQIASKVSKMAMFVAIDGILAGAITFDDELRPESKQTLKQLREIGIQDFLMVTGDNQKTADQIAKTLGIDTVKANVLPTDKLLAVEAVENRPVGFVGDGVNDAPVLAAADVGIALGARGSPAASESADIVIMVDDIERLAIGTKIAKRTIYIAKQSIIVGIAISVGLMFIFASGKFQPVYGAVVQEVVDVIVIFNALRAHGPWGKPDSKLLA